MIATQASTLLARDVHLWRGDRHLLKGISFELRPGALLQLIGPNGVGKTSLLRVCAGLLPFESGELLWDAIPIHRTPERYHSQLAYLAHTNALKSELTAEENLRYELGLRKTFPRELLHSQLETLGIAQCAKLPARVLSAGQRRRLALARIVFCAAPVWILDEPTTNLDANGIALVEQIMATHLSNGGAILAAAHHRLLANSPSTKTLELQS